MASINATLNNKDLTIVGSGLSAGQTLNSNIVYTIEGFDKLNLPFQVLADPLVIPEVEVNLNQVVGLAERVYSLEVLSPGVISATCDNPDIDVSIDNVNRSITLSVQALKQFQDHQGLLTVSIPNLLDKVIPITLFKTDVIDFNLISTNGWNSPYKDPIVFEVIGTTRPITVTCDNPRIKVDVKSKIITVTTTQPEQGIITVTGDGIMPKNGNISTYALQMQATWDPINKEAHYTGEIKVSFPGMTRSDISYRIKDNTTPDMIVSINEDPANPEGFIITSLSGNENKEITFSAPGYDDLVETVTFTKDTVTVTQGNTVETFLDEPLILNVTGTNKDFLVQSLDTDTLDVQLNGSDITITPNKPGDTKVKIFGIYVNEVVVDVKIKPLLPITTSSTTNKEEAKYLDTINLEVTNPTQGVTHDIVSVPLNAISVRKIRNRYEVTSTGPATGTLTFKAKNHAPEIIQIVFKDLDPVKCTITPSSTVEINQVISVQVTDPVNGVGVTPNVGGTIQTVDKGNGLYEFTSNNIETEELTLSCAGYKDRKVQLTFKDIYRGPQFTVNSNIVQFNESDGYTDVEVFNLEGDLNVSLKDEDLLDGFVHKKGDQVFVRLELLKEISQTENTEVTLSVLGQNDVVLQVTVVNDYIPLKHLTLDKPVLYGFETEEATITANTPNPGDNYVVTVDPLVTHRIDIDKIHLTSNVEGDYKVKLELNGYYPKEFFFVVKKKPVVVVPGPSKWFDLGVAPVVAIQATEDTFVDVVFKEPAITTDKEKLAYVLENGTANLKGFEITLCQYQEVMSNKSILDKNENNLGGKMNYVLYGKLKEFLDVENYYLFKSFAMLLLKTMKVYKDDSYKLVNLLRFKDAFKGSETEWTEYEAVMKWFTEYLKNNGQGLTTDKLPFDEDTVAKFENFLLENYIP